MLSSVHSTSSIIITQSHSISFYTFWGIPVFLPAHPIPKYSWVFEINSKKLAYLSKTIKNMFSILAWQDSCSHCPAFPAHVFSGWPHWLFVYYVAMPQALFASVPCILPSSSILLTFFCNWETSQFLSRPFSFFGITCSLIISNHFSICTAWRKVKRWDHWKILRKLLWMLLSPSLFNRFSLFQVLKVTGASHSYWNPTKCFGWPWITALNERKDAHCMMNFIIIANVYTKK